MYKVFCRPISADIYYPSKTLNKSLRVIEIGTNNPAPLYDSKLMHRDVFVLQYVRSGKGMYNGQPLIAPCVFLMIPDSPQGYSVDADSPDFRQFWIKFDGAMAREFLENAGFTIENKVFPCPYIKRAFELFDQVTDYTKYSDMDDEYFMLSVFAQLLALQSSLNKQQARKIISPSTQTVLDYIHENYASCIEEGDLAQLVHLSVNYMHKVFTRDIGTPPIHYLTHYRLRCAKKLLLETDMSISKIAETVGFSGGSYFCRMFQKYNDGKSPTQYRKITQKNPERKM